MTRKLQNEVRYIPLEGDEIFATYDLGLASALITADFDLLTLDKSNLRKVRFIFGRKAGIEKAVNDYWADELKVKGRSYFDNLKMLKNRLYSE